MPTFIEKCCCRGKRPAGVVGLRHNLRPDVTGALLRDRRVPRFLVAPTGYGKSACAYEYAQVVFGFEGVFWVRCDSPCFIRDLDNGTLADQVLRVDAAPKLVVLDDVPHLDAARAEALDGFLHRMLDEDCEVVVACVPSVDAVSSRHLDKILMDGNALLLSDDEVEVERMRGNISRSEADGMKPSGRAACLVWDERGVEAIVRGLACEELPGELELVVFCMLALSCGRVGDLSAMVPDARLAEDVAYLASMFPYLGIDLDAGTFECVDVAPGALVSLSRMSPAVLARSSLQGEREGFCFAVADLLCRGGKERRATEFLAACADKASSSRWAARHGWSLLSECLALPVVRLTEGAKAPDGPTGCALAAQRAWACAMLGDREGAERAARRVLRSSASGWRDVAAAALSRRVLPGACEDDILRDVESALRLRDASGDDGAPDAEGADALFDWECLLRLERARRDGQRGWADAFAAACEEAVAGHAAAARRRCSLLVAGSWFVEACALAKGSSTPEQPEAAGCEGLSPVVSRLSGMLASPHLRQAPSWPECVAVNALQSASEAWPFAFDQGVAPKAVAASRARATALLVQAEEHRRKTSERESAKGEFQLTHEDPFRADAQPAAKVAALRVATPSLVLSLFGGLEAWVGADGSDIRQVRRRNAKIVLALLAMNRGREVTKERLAATIWPDASPSCSRQNLYVVWAYLKKVLKVGSSCPYLVSTQTGYKLDARYVGSDVEEFDELCKGLLFGRDDRDSWEELYEKVSVDFAEDLLPEVTGNDCVDAMRSRYRTQLVDGLVEASSRLGREGETRGSVWFAREALRRDCTREDAYIAMMEAQIASSQRGAAIDTYFECRRFLGEHLGIDPSRRVVELYRSVIEAEEPF